MDFTTPSFGSTGKAIHVRANADIPDLSVYGIGVANNGGGSDGEEYSFDAISVLAGEDILVDPDNTPDSIMILSNTISLNTSIKKTGKSDNKY